MREIIAILTVSVLAYSSTLTGYFGYQDPVESNSSQKVKKDEKERMLQIALTNPKSLTAEEFREIVKYAKDKAVMQQTEESVKNWIKLNNFIMKQADSFQKIQKIVLFKNPELYEEGDLARSGYAQGIKTRSALKKQDELIKSLVGKIALFSFTGSEDDNIKSSQERILWFLQQDYPNLTIISADVRKNDGLYKKLNEKMTPAIWLAYRDKKGSAHWYRVIGGLATKNQILDNIEFIYNNIIKEELE